MTTSGVFIWQDYQRGTKVIPSNFEFITQSNQVTDRRSVISKLEPGGFIGPGEHRKAALMVCGEDSESEPDIL